MRDKTSRPSWSVPRGWPREGSPSMLRRLGRLGSDGASTGASSASRTKLSTTAPPPPASRFFANARQKLFMASPATSPTAHADTRIHEAVGDVGQEVRDEGQ